MINYQLALKAKTKNQWLIRMNQKERVKGLSQNYGRTRSGVVDSGLSP